jgi:hypothetical protein
MSMLDSLFHIFKSADPDKSDDEIKQQIESLKASPDQMSSAMGGLNQPELKADPDSLSLNFPSANSVPSSFDVKDSTHTVTNDGKPGTLASGDGLPTPPKVAPTPAEAPPAPAPVTPENDVETPDPVAAPKKAAPAGNSDAPLKSLLESQKSVDADAGMADAARKKRALGVVPVAAAGIGDAISNAASAFGAQGTSGTQAKVEEGLNKSIDKDKTLFEEKQRKDPTSDVSRHYQKVLGLMLGDHAKSMDVSKMSAENIAATLPEVEKYMQKELGLAQVKATKDQTNAIRAESRQDKLEKEGREWYDGLSKARNGELGVQNAKVDQARHLLQAFKQAEDTGKPFTNATYREIAVGLANLMSNGGKTNKETEDAIAQATMKGDLNKAFTYAGLDPQMLGGTTESMMKALKESILRQGMEAQTQRNKFIDDHKRTMPSGLNKDQYDRITGVDLGNNLDEFNQKKPVVRHPQDQEALDWAKANRNDPRAAKILKANGF